MWLYEPSHVTGVAGVQFSPVQGHFGKLRTEPHSLVQIGSASEPVHRKKLFDSAGNSVSSNFDKSVQVPPELRTEPHSLVQFSFWTGSQTELQQTLHIIVKTWSTFVTWICLYAYWSGGNDLCRDLYPITFFKSKKNQTCDMNYHLGLLYPS